VKTKAGDDYTLTSAILVPAPGSTSVPKSKEQEEGEGEMRKGPPGCVEAALPRAPPPASGGQRAARSQHAIGRGTVPSSTMDDLTRGEVLAPLRQAARAWEGPASTQPGGAFLISPCLQSCSSLTWGN